MFMIVGMNVMESLDKRWGYGRVPLTLSMFEHLNNRQEKVVFDGSEEEGLCDRDGVSRLAKAGQRVVKPRKEDNVKKNNKRRRGDEEVKKKSNSKRSGSSRNESGKALGRKRDEKGSSLGESGTGLERVQQSSIVDSEEQYEQIDDIRLLHNINMNASSSSRSLDGDLDYEEGEEEDYD